MSRILIIIGLIIIAIGLSLKFAPWLVNWFGKLPGDIHYDRGNTKIFFPITSMLLISFVLTMVIRIIKRFF
ncbi:MAG: DUF2905 domain-containing protein [Bacteroidota bacterium]